MKKRISVLLAVVMLLAVAMVITGCGETNTEPKVHKHDIGETKDVEFTVWDGSAITGEGTYNLYLDKDMKMDKKLVLGDMMSTSDITINLCLNGYKWESEGRIADIYDGVTLNICNCSETETTVVGKGDPYIKRAGTFYVNLEGELNVYGKINVTCDNTAERVAYGGVAEVMGKMGIYGATVTGVDVKRIPKENGQADTTTGQGGGICVNSGGELILKDGLITGGSSAVGANVFVVGGSTFTMENSKITGGLCKFYTYPNQNGEPSTSGGNGSVFIEESTFIMKNSEISGAEVAGKAAVMCNKANCVVEMTDSKIINNKSTHATFGGGMHWAKDDGVLKLSGKIEIDNNTNGSGKSNVLIYSPGMVIQDLGMSADSKVGISVFENTAGKVADKNSAAFYADSDACKLVEDNGGWALAKK
ncbi:MAG: hypothetical protein J6Q53_08380 [Oscillospiraceae bacterium]|nr:hypothetical protein [Oscillospiraceae bacterium]